MKEQIKLQECIGLEEGLNIWRCSECGKPLAKVNPGPECYSSRLSELAGIGKYEKVIKPSTTFGVMNPATLCTRAKLVDSTGFISIITDGEKGLLSLLTEIPLSFASFSRYFRRMISLWAFLYFSGSCSLRGA